MKFIIVAIIFQILFALIMDLLYVKFDGLKWVNDDDMIYWILNGVIALPLYFKGYLDLYQKKGLSVILSVTSFVLFGILSAVIMLLFHSIILNAPL